MEDKGLTLSIHYRLAPDHAEEVREIVLEAAGGRPGLEVTEGKMVIEVRPRVEWHKGRAVLFLLDQMRRRTSCARPLPGRRPDRRGRLPRAARAGAPPRKASSSPSSRPAESAASSHLRDPAEVGALFEALADAAPA